MNLPKVLRILYVEDVPEDAELCVRELQKAGYQIAADVVGTKEEFTRKLASGSYDVVLSDYRMPNWSGMEALEVLKRSAKDIPFILVTGTIGEEASAECVKQGAADYILKDRPVRLAAAIRRALEEKAAREERARVEEKLRESEDRYRDLVQHSNDLICTHDLEGKMLSVNPAAIRCTGYSEDELLTMNVRDLLAPRFRGQFENYMAEIQAKGTATGSLLVQTKSGEERTWEYANSLRTRDNAAAIVRGTARDITERKQAQESMADALRFTQKILDTSPIGIITYKASGETVAANPAAAQLIGGSIEQIKAQNFRHIESWRRTRMLAMAEDALASDSPRYGEVHTTSTFGKELWVRAHFVPFTDGDELHLLTLFEDITERKQAEEKLKLFRMLVDQSNDAIQVVELETLRLLDVNDRVCLSLGYTREELLSMSVLDLDPTVDEAFRAKVDDELRKSGAVIIQTLQRRKDGSTFPAEVSMKCVQLDRSYVVCAVRDITERKKAEEALRQAEEKYHRIFDEAVVGIFQTTPDGRILSVNSEMARIYGYDSPAELMASRTDLARQAYVDPSERELFKREVEEKGSIHNYEYQGYRRDGSKLWCREHARVVRDSSGAVLYYEGTVEDITERKSLEEQLRLAQRMEAVGRLAGGVAHDFNNMLGVIIGNTQLLEESPNLTWAQNKRIEEILKAGQRAVAITRQLLAFSRKQVLQPKVLDLNALTADVSKMLRRLIGEDVELTLRAGSDLGCVKADPGQIEQVIMNLAVNARDAMPQGGKLVIETANADLTDGYAAGHPPVVPGNYVMLAVSDTGYGMDAETKARIFEPFFTTKQLGKGTGLGLSIVYGIVKQSGGYIWVYSEPGQGSTFKIYLPRVKESPETIAPQRFGATLPGGAETILLVEDEESLRTMTRTFLEGKGYTILDAESGQEAVDIAGRHRGPIHLLLTDVVMPGMGGRQLAEVLVASRAGIKVLYMSGYTDELVTQHGILNPGVELLEKPFTRESLLRRVRAVLDGGS